MDEFESFDRLGDGNMQDNVGGGVMLDVVEIPMHPDREFAARQERLDDEETAHTRLCRAAGLPDDECAICKHATLLASQFAQDIVQIDRNVMRLLDTSPSIDSFLQRITPLWLIVGNRVAKFADVLPRMHFCAWCVRRHYRRCEHHLILDYRESIDMLTCVGEHMAGRLLTSTAGDDRARARLDVNIHKQWLANLKQKLDYQTRLQQALGEHAKRTDAMRETGADQRPRVIVHDLPSERPDICRAPFKIDRFQSLMRQRQEQQN